MVSLEQPRALAAGAINPLDSMSASAICCGVYLRYGARGPALTSSAMLSFLSFFEGAKVSNLLASLRPGYPSYLGAVEVLNLDTIPLPVFEYLAFNPLVLHP